MEHKDVFVKAKLIRGADRIDNCIVAIEERPKRINQVKCSAYVIYSNKPDIENILNHLRYEYEDMIKETESFKEKEFITKIFGKIKDVIRRNQ